MKVVKTDKERSMTLTEIAICRQFEESDRPGQAFLWPLVHSEDTAPHLSLSLERICRFAVVFLDGTWSVAHGNWYHRNDDGVDVPVEENPLEDAWQSAMSIQRRLKEEGISRCFVIPVVVFTDMEEDQEIMRKFGKRQVRPLWGIHDLVDRLAALPKGPQIQETLLAQDVAKDAETLTCPPADNPGEPAAMTVEVGEVKVELEGDTVSIQITITIDIRGCGWNTGP